MGELELALELLADFVSVMSQRWKELVMSVVSWRRMNHSSWRLEIAVVLEVTLVVLLEQEEPGLPQEWVEHLELVQVAEVLGSKSSCTGILAQYQILQ
jgi:hypothetical protein